MTISKSFIASSSRSCLRHSGLAWLALCAILLKPAQCEDPKAAQDASKPATAANKPAEGVSIKLKLLPDNQSKTKDDKSKADPKTAAKPEPKNEPKTGDEKKPESTAEAKPEAKPEKSGTVELKLLPAQSTEQPKVLEKPKNEKPAGTVAMSVQPPKAVEAKTKAEPTGTVEVMLQPPKAKAEAPGTETGNGKVSIELIQPPKARRTISDTDNSASNGPLVLELEQPSAVTRKSSDSGESNNELMVDTELMSDDDAELSNESSDELNEIANDESAEAKTNPTRGGDPGDPGDGDVKPLPSQPGDVPLVQEAHPFDAPAAKATEGESRFRTTSSGDADLGSESDRERRRRIDAVLDYYRTHPENVVRRGPWALMHAILPYGVETEVIAGKRKVNAIGWLCHNGISAKQRMFQPTQSGFRTNVGPGVQGHEGQFLAILAQSHVQADYPIQIGNKKYTIRDLVKYEMATCREKTELTFKLIGFTHYLEPQQTWRDNRGRPWSIEKLVAEELAQPINGEACGGTHRLMGLTCAVVSRQEAGLPITGHFERAEKFLNDFVEYALTLQNADGSFSTEWFERRAEEPNLERKVQTTGHILEWLVYTLPDEHLKAPEIEKAVDFLLNNIGKNPSRDWPIGPRGHSLRALALYQKRAHKGQSITSRVNVANQPVEKVIQR